MRRTFLTRMLALPALGLTSAPPQPPPKSKILIKTREFENSRQPRAATIIKPGGASAKKKGARDCALLEFSVSRFL
jgi:hypothetical protein